MPSFRRQSLAGRLILTYAVAVVMVLAVLGLLVERAARDALLSEVEYGLQEQAALVAEALAADEADVGEVVSRLAPQVDARVTVVAADGSVIADSHGDPAEMENHAGRPEVAAAYRGEVGSDRRVSESTGFEQTYVAMPGPGGRVVRLSLPQSIIDAPVRSLRLRLLLLVGGAAVLGVVVVALVAHRLARPLQRLSDVTAAIAAGESRLEVPHSTIIELDDLGRSIQAMDEQLGARLNEIDSERITFGAVLDALPHGILYVDATDGVLYANRSLEQVLGPVPARLEDMVPFRIQEVVRQARAGGNLAEEDAEYGRPARVLRLQASPLGDGRVVVVVSDVTERRRVDDVRRDFVTNASHELKTPVASILAAAETLQVALERAPERAPEFASQIEASARALSRLVTDLLDLSRLESRQTRFEDVDLAGVARQEASTLTKAGKERGIHLVVEVEPVRVRGAAGDLGLGVRNLLDNAIRYSEPGGEVTLRLRQEGDEAVLTVADRGQGIPQRDLDRVFERFYRIDEARSRSTGGTGLGLAIVRHVVEAHGGRVSVESELGAGSTFTVRLPINGRDEATQSR